MPLIKGPNLIDVMIVNNVFAQFSYYAIYGSRAMRALLAN